MNQDDLRIIKYHLDLSRRFGNWVLIQDRSARFSGKKRKKEFVNYIESLFGSLGIRWQYSGVEDSRYIIKLNTEQDLMILLLKFKKN
jgi:hypothetical protein